MRKAYKYRIYPNNEQQNALAKMFGCCRFVYNQTLAYRKECLEKHNKTLTVKDCIGYYHKVLKPANPWLADADERALISAIYQMDLAFRQALKNHGSYPKFKRKQDHRTSYTTHMMQDNISVDFINGTIQLPLLPTIKATLHRSFVGSILSATISRSWSGKYYVSFVVEAKHQDLPHTAKNIGLDLRHAGTCITSDGSEYVYDPLVQTYSKRLARLEKQRKRKTKGSRNYFKLKHEIALCHERIINAKNDARHKISHKVISENQVIIFERLQANGNPSDPPASVSEFQKLLEHKAKLNHRYYVKVDSRTVDLSFGSCQRDPSSQEIAKRILMTGLKQIS